MAGSEGSRAQEQQVDAFAAPGEISDVFDKAIEDFHPNNDALVGKESDAVGAYLKRLTRPLLGSAEAEAEVMDRYEAGLTARNVLAVLGVELDDEGFPLKENGQRRPSYPVADRQAYLANRIQYAYDSSAGSKRRAAIEKVRADYGALALYAGRIALRNDMDTTDLLPEGYEPGQADAKLPTRRELELLARDGARAREHMIEANLRLAASIAKRYVPIGKELQYGDLIQEANIGLIRAVGTFDHQKGYRFIAHAKWWIRHYISRAITDTGTTIRLPLRMADDYRSLRRIEQDIFEVTGKQPTFAQIAQRSHKFTEDEVADIISRGAITHTTSLQFLVDGHDQELGDFIVDKQAVNPADEISERLLSEEVIGSLVRLDPRLAEIIARRTGLKTGEVQSVSEVARYFRLSRASIKYLEQKGYDKLREMLAPGMKRPAPPKQG